MYGHIPHGFYKDQMQGFFQELGAIKKRVSIVWNRKMKLVVHGDPRCTDRRYQRSRGKCKCVCVCVKNYCLNSRSALRSFKRYVAYSNVCGDFVVGWKTSSIRRQHELPKMITLSEVTLKSLNRIPWERVDVSFKRSRQWIFAHSTIQVCYEPHYLGNSFPGVT
ncbi:uncharacterized protein [Triticum aestivum]|uniref:uncharacterized protein n=1 Tax=Triticum aestivum TaxID=4565 RepID=UPI001D02A72D|nr:uncharacterized protein LOC123067710 [Triticum aestivum]